MTLDFRSIVHILSSPNFEKPWQTRSFLARLIGRGESPFSLRYSDPDHLPPGIFSQEGAAHRMQRRIIAPAFTLQSIKNMTPVFFQKAEEIAERFKDSLGSAVKLEEDAPSSGLTPEGTKIDVALWISRASFDIMGLTGLNYDFHSVQDESEEVYMAYRRMFNIADKGLGLREILELFFPIIRKIFVSTMSTAYKTRF